MASLNVATVLSKKLDSAVFAALVIQLSCLILLAFVIERNSFFPLLVTFSASFGSYIYLTSNENIKTHESKLRLLFIITVSILIFAFPFWSDDIYRFIWDGKLWHLGIHPFSIKPDTLKDLQPTLVNSPPLDNLFPLLNSPSYFTIYPPICQLTFWISTAIFPHSLIGQVIVLKLFFAGFLFGIAYFLQGLCGSNNQRAFYLILLNPLLLIEGIGNLHYELVMIFFLLGSLHFIQKKQIILAATLFSGAVLTKIIPLMLLPSILIYLGIKKGSLFVSITLLVSLIAFLIVIEPCHLYNFLESVRLYFKTFEFNASIYYVYRAIGYHIKGYNLIASYGKYVPFLVFIAINFISILKMDKSIHSLTEKWFWIFLIYYALATTVHPWYILPIFVFGTMNNRRTGLTWSLLIILSYHAYGSTIVQEKQIIILFEYFIIYIVLIFDILNYVRERKTINTSLQTL